MNDDTEDTNMSNVTISPLTMQTDGRLRRLFALVGSALYENDIDPHSRELESLLLDIAPEFLAPEGVDDPELWDEWREMVNESTT